MARGVEDVAQENGYTLLLCNTDEDLTREIACLKTLRSRLVDGVLLAPPGDAHEYLSRLVDAGYPVVLVDRDLHGLRSSAVLLDNERAAHDAVRHLIALGHRRIAMLTSRASMSTTTERLAGYRRALSEMEVAVDEHLIVSGESTSEGGLEAANTVLDLELPPTALFSGNNLMSIGALQAIARRGLRVSGGLGGGRLRRFPLPVV